MKYKLVRSYYRSVKDMEANRFYKEADLGFGPCSAGEAVILKSKCTEHAGSIVRIIPVG